jgi:1,4-dihydroxy-2-naphthoate octaprenyltransferase
MFRAVKLLAVISRTEFLPALASFFVMGLSWGINPHLSLKELVIPAVLVFAIIMLGSLVGLQLNTIFDHDLDCRDNRKAALVQAFDSQKRDTLKLLAATEALFGSVFVSLLMLDQGKPALLFMWIVGIFLAYAYSVPPLRLKSRSWLALIALLLCICVLPLLFTFYAFASEFDPYFLVFLIGQALSAYSVILPAEIGDYFEDNSSGIETVTVRIGLVKASFSSILLLAAGGILTGTAFFAKLSNGLQPILNIFLLTVAVADLFVLRKLVTLHLLSKEYVSSKNQNVAQEIRRMASHDPRWVILVSQTIVFMSLILLVGKLLI